MLSSGRSNITRLSGAGQIANLLVPSIEMVYTQHLVHEKLMAYSGIYTHSGLW